VVVPVADPTDAKATAAALAPYVDDANNTVIAVHVIEKASGAPDKASVEQREEYAEKIFAVLTEGFADIAVAIDTQIHYGTDIATTIIKASHDAEAGAIVFTLRGESRWKKLLSGDVTHKLVNNSDVPILILPDPKLGDK
jgi:nucleotide-binding universal stress UspA family protein